MTSPRPPLTDLPLRPGERRPGPSTTPPAPSPPRTPAKPGGPPGRPPSRRRRGGSRTGLWLLLLLVVAATAGGAYFWLRPQPATPVYSPPSLEFGQALVGIQGSTETVVVSNGGERPMVVEEVSIRGSEAADFTIVEDGCSGEPRAPGESCALKVGFSPAAIGVRRAAVHLKGSLGLRPHELPLAGVGIAPRTVLDPPSVDFAEQPVDTETESQLVRISNDGTAPLKIDSIQLTGANAGDFTVEERCAGRTFGPEEKCAFRVTFGPRAAGPRRAEVQIAGDAPGEPAVAILAGTGLWSGPPFTAEPVEVGFGSQRIGGAGTSREVRLVNRTATPRTAPELVPPRSSSGFAVQQDGCSGKMIASGESCGLSLRFRPLDEGRVEASLTVRDAGQPAANVVLNGVGVAPHLTVDRRSVDFGDLRVGFRSANQTVSLRNSGTDSLAVRSVTLAGGQAAAFSMAQNRCSGSSLGPGQQCSIGVTFAPSRAGDWRASLSIHSDATAEPERVTLSGRGTTSSFGVRPGRLEFDPVMRGEAEERSLEITNVGNARLEMRGVRTAGPAAADYQLTQIGCRLDRGLTPGETCALTVEFRPSADGPRPALLVLEHDGPESPREVQLSGFGEPPRPGLALSPETIGFGNWPVGDRSGIQTVTIRNTGKGNLVIRDVAVSGPHADDYRVVPGTCQGAPRIVAGAACTVGIGFRPQAAGVRAADLVIRHNADSGSSRVQLRGEGVR